jgi:hypothetical protein
MNRGPISWKAKRQPCTTLSSAEAEFVAASLCGQEVIYLRALLCSVGLEQVGPTPIWEDNAACILMSENPAHPDRARHIDVKVHFLRDMVREGVVKLQKVAGVKNVADALTKSLPVPTYINTGSTCGGLQFPSPPTGLASRTGSTSHVSDAGSLLQRGAKCPLPFSRGASLSGVSPHRYS